MWVLLRLQATKPCRTLKICKTTFKLIIQYQRALSILISIGQFQKLDNQINKEHRYCEKVWFYLICKRIDSTEYWDDLFNHCPHNFGWNRFLKSRERHKSAPYPRLKNSKRTWKCQKTQSIKFTKNSNDGTERGILSHFLTSFVAKRQKIEGWKNLKRKFRSQCRKNWKADTLGFFNIHSVAKHQKGGLFGKNFCIRKMSHCRKILRGDSLLSHGMVWYAER